MNLVLCVSVEAGVDDDGGERDACECECEEVGGSACGVLCAVGGVLVDGT